MTRFSIAAGLVLSLAALSSAAVHEDRIALRQGVLQIHDLNAAICRDLGLPACPAGGSVDLNSTSGGDFLFAVNSCLWDGCSLRLADNSTAILQIDTPTGESTCESLRRLSRVYTAEKAPAATAAQARNWGLLPAQAIDPSRHLVILIHGLDADRSDCLPIGDLLLQSGHQVAYFSYPGDQPIADSAALLARSLATLRASYPHLIIDIVAHSMGGLVARQYVESPNFPGGVDHLILVAPPNHGSSWARLRTLLSLEENAHLHKNDPHWHWTWLVTEGMGEAGADLLPGSPFLRQLNNRPRRPGVRYTIVAGSKSSVQRVESNCIQTVSHWIPTRARSWWGVRTCCAKLTSSADHVAATTGNNDGPVSIQSARLAGVTDFVIVPADHISLYLPVDGNPPAAWRVIESRLDEH